MGVLADIRAGLADPFAQTITVGPAVLTRAEARAIERALSVRVTERSLRLPRVTIVWRGAEVVR